MKIGQSAGKSFAYVLGVYLGDGCVTKDQGYERFRLNTIDLDFAQATAVALDSLGKYRSIINGPYHDKRFSNSRPQWQLYYGGTELCATLKELTQSKQQLPESIFSASREDRLAFIAGLMDSEGFVAEGKQNPTNRRFYMGFRCCDIWIRDFVRLLEGVGIKISDFSAEKPYKDGYKVPFRFTIKMQSWIDSGAYFAIQRKQQRVLEWVSMPAYAMRTARRLASETTRQTA